VKFQRCLERSDTFQGCLERVHASKVLAEKRCIPGAVRHGKIQGCVKRGEHIPGAFVGRQVHGEKRRILVVFEERWHIPVVLQKR